MAYANNQGVRIHYELTGEGEPLVLQHGFFSSIEDWYVFGYVDILGAEFQLIMVDGRGHGASDKPQVPEAYSLELRAGDITAVLDDLGIEKAHYLGYSMGGWIGFGMALYAPERLDKLIIGGAQPYGRNFSGAREILMQGMDAWIEAIKDWGAYSAYDLERYRKNDAEALLAAIGDREDISEVIQKMDMPCLFYAGEEDGEYDLMKGLAKEVNGAQFISFPGFNHIEAVVHGGVVAPRLVEFLLA